MIDLDRMVERFLGEAVEFFADGFLKYDSPAIGALKLKDQNQSLAAGRGEAVLKWLRYYRALQGLNGDEEAAVVNEILKFADAHDLTVSPTSKDEIIGLFCDLHDRCSEKVRRNKNGALRDLTSLTSKALWCCYPDAIPLFDSRAERALCVISHLMDLTPPPPNSKLRYEPFLSVWLELYARVEPTIDKNRHRFAGFCHKVRVFDIILWTIGTPTFWGIQGL